MSSQQSLTPCYSRDFIDAKYRLLEHLAAKENTDALKRVSFCQTPREGHQHLDIGCGPGTFTRDKLVPRALPCKRIVGLDRSSLMVEFAKANSSHENVTFNVFNFGDQDVQELIVKYGRFDRVYSFLCFHYMKDEPRAYRDLAELLTAGSGECLIVSALAALLPTHGSKFISWTVGEE
ncbi:juvenile hormone acid O-methyltransferase-like [Amblyomma americanum]